MACIKCGKLVELKDVIGGYKNPRCKDFNKCKLEVEFNKKEAFYYGEKV